MKTSRVIQFVLILLVFAAGVAFFNSGTTTTDTPSSEGYVPPSP